MNTKPSFSYGIKGKLISAVSMLLVAVIMVVSSTYAWFTLSTAPEVTGISTAIGANGALEIRLNADSSLDRWNPTNTEWGNLVSFTDDNGKQVYGLDKILLLPAELNATGNTVSMAAPLKYPTYGPDGRPSSTRQDALLGLYDEKTGNFDLTQNVDGYGVVAVGSASGLTDRQMAFRQASTAAETAITLATNKVAKSMQDEGGNLAGIVVAHLVTPEAKVSVAQLNSLKKIIDALNGTDGALNQIKTAYEQMLIAAAASKNVGASNEDLYVTMRDAIDKANADGEDLVYEIASNNGTIGVTGVTWNLTDTAFLEGIQAYKAVVDVVNTASDKLNELLKQPVSEGVDWTAATDVIYQLINYENGYVEVCKIQIKPGMKKQEVINACTENLQDITVVLGEGSGVYESIADLCKDYEANIRMNVDVDGMTLNNIAATMMTDSSQINADGESYLKQAIDEVGLLGSPDADGAAAKPLTEHYGYLLNFEFKTNASGSNLLLQTAPIDRIYGENNVYEGTQGSGSNMVFAANSGSNFDDAQIKGLMSAVRVVFLAEDGTILEEARLDAANATAEGTALKANLYLWQAGVTSTVYTLTYGDGQTLTVYTNDNGTTYYSDSACTEENKLDLTTGTYADGKVTSKKVTSDGSFIGTTDVKDAVITDLNQNDPKAVSVLVYIDGNEVENEDVAYDMMSSVTGALNLQFSSDANLVPMEYGEFIESGSTTKYKVTYNVGKGVTGTVSAAEVASGGNITLADGTGLSKEGYTFGGWSTTEGGTTPVASLTNVTEDKTVYAIWTQTT